MRRLLLALALSLSLYGTATADPIVSTLAGDSTVATGITGLEIPGASGVIYDVDFSRVGESFNAIFGVGDPPSGLVPTFYNTPALASEMNIAIMVALTNHGGIEVLGDIEGEAGTWGVPTSNDEGDELNSVAVHYGLLTEVGVVIGFVSAHSRTVTAPTNAFAVFSTQPAVIPEPSSVTLALMGAVGLLGYGWRRKRKRANVVGSKDAK